jgi:phage-related protein
MAKGPGGFSVGRVSIQVVPDTSNFRKELQAKLKQAIKGLKVEIPVDVNAKKAITQLRVLDRQVRRLNGRTINIGAKVSQKGDLDALSNSLSKLGKSASDASDGFSNFGRTGLIVLGVVVLLAPALALIATLLAGLPSLLFAFGGAAAAVGLGMEGLKKAAQGFTPTIDRLKASLSKTFADQLTKPFIELNKIAPVLDRGLNAIAVSLSGIVKDFIKFVTSAQGMAQINDILQNSAKFFNLLRPAIDSGLKSLFLLASEASQEFGVLAATLNRFSASFLDMVKRVSGDGTLGSALRNLNIVLDSLLEAFVRFFEAGLKAMTVLGGPITNLFVGFTDAIVALMPILTAVSKLVFDVLGEAFKQLAPVVKAITPFIETLGKLLGTILVNALRIVGPLLTRVAEILNQVLIKALAALTPIIDPLLKFFGDLAALLGEALLQAFILLTPFLNQFFKFLTDLLIALTPLLPKITELATTVLRALIDAFIQLSPKLLELGQTLFPQLIKVITDLVPLISKIIDIAIQIIPPLVELAAAILSVVIPAMTEFSRIISEVWPSIQQIIDGVLTHIQGIINVVLGVITGDWRRAHEGFKQIVSGAWEGIKGIVKTGLALFMDLIIGIPSRVATALFGLPAQFALSGRAMMQGLIDGIKGMAGAVVNAALGVVKQVRDLLPFSPAKTGPFSGQGYTLYSGIALMEDWAKGIREGAPTAVKAMEDAASMAQSGLDIQAAVTAEGFGGIGLQVAKAIEGMEIKADGTQIAKVVNKNNNMNARR